jgi:hypothetical protein
MRSGRTYSSPPSDLVFVTAVDVFLVIIRSVDLDVTSSSMEDVLVI